MGFNGNSVNLTNDIRWNIATWRMFTIRLLVFWKDSRFLVIRFAPMEWKTGSFKWLFCWRIQQLCELSTFEEKFIEILTEFWMKIAKFRNSTKFLMNSPAVVFLRNYQLNSGENPSIRDAEIWAFSPDSTWPLDENTNYSSSWQRVCFDGPSIFHPSPYNIPFENKSKLSRHVIHSFLLSPMWISITHL